MTRRPHEYCLTDKAGRERWYVRKVWREGGKQKVRLWKINAPRGTAEYDAEYWRLRAGMDDRQKPDTGRTWGDLIGLYRQTPRYRNLSASATRSYDRAMARILDKSADRPVSSTTRQAVRAAHARLADTPSEADRLLHVLRLLLNHARVELEWIDRNVAEGIAPFGSQTRREAWPLAAQKAFENGCRNLDEPDALTAFMLGIGTGQRIGDILAMEWAHFDGQYISLRQSKTGTRLTVYCPERLRAYLDGLTPAGRFIIARNLTEPKSYSQVHKAVMRVRKAVNLTHLTIHGWRATAAVELSEAGCTPHEVAAITGHKDLDMVMHYTRDADQKRLSRQAQERRGQNTNGT